MIVFEFQADQARRIANDRGFRGDEFTFVSDAAKPVLGYETYTVTVRRNGGEPTHYQGGYRVDWIETFEIDLTMGRFGAP